MADVEASIPVVEEGESSRVEQVCEDPEPKAKKARLAECELRLEERLNGILRCTVCLDLPKVAMFQCTNGHLMCAMCFSHLLADARLKDETATCPNCRCEISKSQCSRNLAVEKAVSELPSDCQFCSRELPRHMLDHHEQVLCQDRIVTCPYTRIGCTWRGPHHELTNHEAACAHPRKSGLEIMDALRAEDERRADDVRVHEKVYSMLSYEKITFMDIQLRPYRTDDFITKLYYETSRLTALGVQWVVKARVNEPSRPAQSCERTLYYQLACKSRLSAPAACSFLLVQGPYGQTHIPPAVYSHHFTNDQYESEYQPLPIDSHACNRLLAAKTIGLRLILLQLSG